MLVAANLLLAWPLEPPTWLQPNCVGLAWASAFYAGTLFSVGRGSLIQFGIGGTLFFSSNSSFYAITDFPAAESLVFCVSTFGFGWFVASRDKRSRPAEDTDAKSRLALGNFSIWDICVVTMIIACMLRTIPNLSVHPLFFIAVFLTMLNGAALCWLVCRWVWHDSWSLASLFWLATPCIVGTGLLLALGSSDQTLGSTFRWLMTGPIAVNASQALCVLALFAARRLDFKAQSFITASQHGLSS